MRRLPSPARLQSAPRPSSPLIGWEGSAIGGGSRHSAAAAASTGFRAGGVRVAWSGPCPRWGSPAVRRDGPGSSRSPAYRSQECRGPLSTSPWPGTPLPAGRARVAAEDVAGRTQAEAAGAAPPWGGSRACRAAGGTFLTCGPAGERGYREAVPVDPHTRSDGILVTAGPEDPHSCAPRARSGPAVAAGSDPSSAAHVTRF